MDMLIPGVLNPHSFYVLDTKDMRIFYLEPMTRIKYDARTMIPHQTRLLIRGDGVVIAGSMSSFGEAYDWNGSFMDRFVQKAISRHHQLHNLFITDDGQHLIGIQHCLPNYSLNVGTTGKETIWRGLLVEEPPMSDVVALYNRALSLYIQQGVVLARYYRSTVPRLFEQNEADILREAGLYFLD